eukprot:Pgem_evm1s17903
MGQLLPGPPPEAGSKATVHLISGWENTMPTLVELNAKYPGFSEKIKRGDLIEDVGISGYRSD